MAEITERYQFIISAREEIYVDDVLADVYTKSYNSLVDNDTGSGRFIIDNDLFTENIDAIEELENSGSDLIDGELEEIKTSLNKKGLTINPDAQPLDPDSRDGDTTDDESDDDTGDESEDDSGSGHGNFRDPANDD